MVQLHFDCCKFKERVIGFNWFLIDRASNDSLFCSKRQAQKERR
jgi:hypothetical protein